MTLPFIYLGGIGVMYIASYIAVVEQIGEVSSGGYFLIFWMFQNPPDLLFSLIKAMVMATVIVLVGCYYGYTAWGGPVGVGTATAKSMVLNIVLVHIIGMMGIQHSPRARDLRHPSRDVNCPRGIALSIRGSPRSCDPASIDPEEVDVTPTRQYHVAARRIPRTDSGEHEHDRDDPETPHPTSVGQRSGLA